MLNGSEKREAKCSNICVTDLHNQPKFMSLGKERSWR